MSSDVLKVLQGPQTSCTTVQPYGIHLANTFLLQHERTVCKELCPRATVAYSNSQRLSQYLGPTGQSLLHIQMKRSPVRLQQWLYLSMVSILPPHRSPDCASGQHTTVGCSTSASRYHDAHSIVLTTNFQVSGPLGCAYHTNGLVSICKLASMDRQRGRPCEMG